MLRVCDMLPEWDRMGREGQGLCGEPVWPSAKQGCDGHLW